MTSINPTNQTTTATATTYESDIPPSNRPTHKSGILHTFKTIHGVDGESHADPAVVVSVRNNAFAWLVDRHHETVEKIMTKLVQSGFDALFIPFSSMANWMERYPHACELPYQ
mmetsp:Transcript_86/g.184  ORF Transcript_86/g.184 Transcript_86/m.184 type:complete len:113 (+) Transcript_86:130-468(+)